MNIPSGTTNKDVEETRQKEAARERSARMNEAEEMALLLLLAASKGHMRDALSALDLVAARMMLFFLDEATNNETKLKAAELMADIHRDHVLIIVQALINKE